MSSLTFESLPDEILMMIFQFSGEICQILRSYLGLNERLNKILLDRQLHLFTDYLSINPRNDYYDSEIFQQVSQQLSSINTTVDEGKFNQLLQPLVSFHIRQRYLELGEEFQSTLVKYHAVRQQSSVDELLKVDYQLKTQSKDVRYAPTMDSVRCMISLVLTKGARLVCEGYELGEYNLAEAVHEQITFYINEIEAQSTPLIKPYLRLCKALIISNPSLLQNRAYIGNGYAEVEYFLVYSLCGLKHYYGSRYSATVNMKCFRVIVDLFLFILQCYKQTSGDDEYIQRNLTEMLGLISETGNNLYIRTVQLELIKILVDQFDLKASQSVDDYWKENFRGMMRHLIQNKRLDVLKYVLSHSQLQEIYDEPEHIRKCMNMITRNRMERRFFYTKLDNELLNLLFAEKHLLFILLAKKERRLIEKVLQLSPHLIDQLDDQGNDPLLYLCIKVNGCRHRMIEMLIKMGSNVQRRNFQGQNFMDTLLLKRNQSLRSKLIEHEIIKFDM